MKENTFFFFFENERVSTDSKSETKNESVLQLHFITNRSYYFIIILRIL